MLPPDIMLVMSYSSPPSSDNTSCLLYLLRHGATANNLARPPRLQGRHENPPLSEKGRHQASASACALAEKSIAAVYSSPLRRAVETADPIAERLGLLNQTIDELIEVDVGAWEGRDWGEIEQNEPEAYRRFMEDPAANPYTGGESLAEVAERVLPAFSKLMQRHLGSSIVVVSHNVVNRVYLAHLMGMEISQARSIVQKNCGINVIRMRDGNGKLITANSVLHLTEF